ncbi:uncharacterized protein ACRADG_004976 isoform 2-T5 [Cochliomyia hominivorax]
MRLSIARISAKLKGYKGATLVEEEDFNELTAVPTTTASASASASAATTTATPAVRPTNIVIASTTATANSIATTTTNTTTQNDLNKGNNRKVSRHLPPLKLQSNESTSITPSAGQGPCSTIAASVRNVLQRQQASSTTSPTQQQQQPHQQQTKSKRTTTTPNITSSKDDDFSAIQANEHTPLFSDLQRAQQQQQQLSQTPTSAASSNTSPNNSIIANYQTANVLNNTTVAASTATPHNYNNSSTTTTNNHTFSTTAATTATTTTYSHNSKTTRSWPVIYRNPHHYDYEALYAPTNANNLRANHNQYQQQYVAPSVTFKQNCYSNQFKQSIVYSSSNEDLTTINECASANGVVANGGRSSSGSSSIFGGGNSNTSCNNLQKLNQQQQQQQTTCYYFSPSRHNSIYEHPSAVVASSLQFDPHTSAATTAAAAAAVESIRRSNSILLRNSSCSSKIMHQTGGGGGGGNLDSPTSLNSAMDVTSNVGSSTCCSSCCMGPPPVLFLFVTLLMTTSATAMLCAAIMTDHWEHVKWDRVSLDRYSNRSNLQLEWIMEDKVAMLKPDKRADHRFRRDNLFLVPMHGGIWTLCIDLPLHEIQELRRHPKFPRSAPTCLNYLAGSSENARGEEQRNDWQHRMQNLSISCSLVCLIILGSAALVGAFGVCQRQISAILITGVMYLLAALFALFTLMIIHFKRQQGRPMLDSDYDGTVDGIVARPGGPAIMAKPLLGARIFLTSWSLDLGWGGVVLCAITSVLWILLSKIMRYNPFSTLMI